MKTNFLKYDFLMVKSIFTKKNLEIFLLLVAVLVGLYYDWGNVDIAIFALFIYSILHSISSRYFAIGGLAFLTLTPVLLALGKDAKAEEFAVYAFYFLSMTLLFAFLEMKREEEK